MPNRIRGTVSVIAVLIVNLTGRGLGPPCVAAIGDYGFGDSRRIGQALAIAAPPVPPMSDRFDFYGVRAYARSRRQLLMRSGLTCH